MFLVRAAIALAMVIGTEHTERSGAIWISASQMASRPQRSAASTCSKAVSKASASLCPGRRWNSWKTPNSKVICCCSSSMSLAGKRQGGLVREGRHDVASETADLLTRAAEIDDDVFDAALLQSFELAHDLVGGAEKGAFGTFVPGLFLVVENVAAPRLAVRPPRQRVDPHMPLIPPLDCCRLLGRVLRDVHGARDTDLHRVEGPPQRLDLAAELGDLREGFLGERMLPQQHIIAAPGDFADRVGAPRPHPERRVRLLRGRRLDDDVVELPKPAAMRERRLRGEGLGDDLERFLEARVGLVQG